MEKLVLIDGNSLINRAFYAMPPLSTADGVYTNAVYGFMNMFFKMLEDVKPTACACAFDLKAPTFRHKLYSDYKGTRKPMPEELRPQIPLLKDLLRLMNVCVVEKEGSEADDIIGTIAKHNDCKTIIFTGDRDAFQLVDPSTEVHFTKRGITEVDVYTADNFKEKTGITPAQIIELKALMGDSSDNIPGVPGVGEKTAYTLLEQFGDVQTLYENAEALTGKLKDKIIAGKESCFLSKTLATIDTDCGVDTDINKMKLSLPFPYAVKQRFAELQFNTFLKKDAIFGLPDNAVAEAGDLKEEKPELITVDKTEKLLDKTFDFDCAVYIDDEKLDVYCNNKEYRLPIAKTLLDDGFTLPDAVRFLSAVFRGKNNVTLFDKKQFRHVLKDASAGDITAPVSDVALMKYLADYKNGNETAKTVIIDYGKDETLPAYSLYVIADELKQKLKEQGIEKLYYDVELPLSDVLFDMEVSGFKADAEALNKTGEIYRKRLAETEKKIREIAGEPDLNVNSPQQLGDLLFEKLKIGKGKKTKKGYSTSADILETYADASPIIPLILDYRRIQKLQSTYVEGLKPLIDKATGLIHTSFNQTVTATGRLSSKEPNLQNIPVRDDEGKELRRFFVPRADDRILISADYSQIELRLLAAFSGCKGLVEAFREGKDVHASTAAKVFGIPLEKVTPAQRGSAKAVNFGIIYGISEYGLAKNINVSPDKAREYIRQYFIQYPEIKEYMNANVAFAKEHGYVSTILGRRRYIPELKSSNYMLRQFGERVAMNMPLQGSSADIIKLAMLGVHNRLQKENADGKLILQVHDELIVDAADKDKDKVIKILKEEMENAVNLSVKLTVSVSYGKTWYDAK